MMQQNNGMGISKTLQGIGTVDNIRNVINSYRFIDVAEVTEISDKYIACKVGNRLYSHVEVLPIGNKHFSISLMPTKGDAVLLFCPYSFVNDTDNIKVESDIHVYTVLSYKCIPIAKGNAPQTITATDSVITIQGKHGKLEIS